MGGCAGKKKANPDELISNSTKQKPESMNTDDNLQSNSSPSTAMNLPSSTDPIHTDIKVLIDEQDKTTNALHLKTPSRVVPVADSDPEHELANLVYGHPETDYAESPPIATKFKESDV